MFESVYCELISADLAGALQIIYRDGMILRDVLNTKELTIRFVTDRSNLSRLQFLMERHGSRLRVLRRMGLSQKLRPLMRHPLLLLWIGILTALTVWIPTRIFFIQVEGNQTLSAKKILEQAELAGIVFGCSREEIRSEKLKNGFLERMPELQWAGINTSGCVATITVRERSQSQDSNGLPVSEIIAVRDGIIRSCTVVKGVALCNPGQAVRSGQVLISGLSDCGRTILVTGAEGDVFAETTRTLTAVGMNDAWKRTDMGVPYKNISLLLGKKQINFYNDSGILDASCVKMYLEYYITLPGGFCLPVGIGVESVIPWSTEEAFVEVSSEQLTAQSGQYLLSHMSAGQILSQESHMVGETLYTDYICLEMIGQNRYEEITKEHGKNYGENS